MVLTYGVFELKRRSYLGIFSKKKVKKPPQEGVMKIEIFPLHLMEGSMINALLEALQEISGMLMTSRLVERLAGAFFVIASIVSGIALLITVMYLASPENFEKRVQKVLVEKPVVGAVAEGKKAEAEGVEEKAAGEAEAE